jgi:thermitase
MQPGISRRSRAAIHAVAFLALACILVPAAALGSASRLSSTIAQGSDSYVPGEVVVRFEASASAVQRQKARRAAAADFDRTIGVPRAQLVDVEGSVKRAIRRFEGRPGVAYAQPNFVYSATAAEPPDDTFFEELWGLSDPATPNPGVGALEAWETTKGSGEVIAVLDTGIDLTHPDLVGNLWENPSPDPLDEDLHGFDFVDDDGNPDDYNFHGTHVAGTAAAIADNGLGVAGVAPEAQVMAVRVLDGDGSGSTADIAAGIDYAAQHGADVINMSLGGPAGAGDKAMEDAIEAAGVEKDVVVVVAAGNDGADVEAEPQSPCVLPQDNLICVAALHQKSETLANFSNFGAKSVDLAAPGTNVISSKPSYGPALFADDFGSGLGLWMTKVFNGGIPWGTSSAAASPPLSATDSPGENYGAAPDFSKTAESDLFTKAAVNLSAQRGCRMHFNTRYQIETFFDVFLAGAISGSSLIDVAEFDGTSPGFSTSFIGEEASVSELDGLADVHPIFSVLSDHEVELDGAYVDDVLLFCRGESYDNLIASSGTYDLPESSSYVSFQGTSMATPHVAGEVALVRAAAPSLSAAQVVKAVLDGTSAIPVVTPGKRTVTEGIADACKAIAIATGGDIATQCPASSDPVPQPPPPIVPTEEQIVNANPAATIEPAPTPRRKGFPQTLFRRRPPKVLRTDDATARAVFVFASDEADATFLCKLDRGSFRQCSRRLVRRLAPGPHVLRVKARDADGNVDPTPAVYRFRVERVG